jgi:hypothetical protein
MKIKCHKKLNLKEEYYEQVLNRMPERFRAKNIQSYQLGQALYREIINKSP